MPSSNLVTQFNRFVLNPRNSVRLLGALSIDLVSTTFNILGPLKLVEYLSAEVNAVADSDIRTQAVIYGTGYLVAQVMPQVRNLFVDSVRANVQAEVTQALTKKVYESEMNDHVLARNSDFSTSLSKNYSSVDSGIPSLFGEIVPFFIEQVAITIVLAIKFGPVGLAPVIVMIPWGAFAVYSEGSAQQIRKDCTVESYKGYGVVTGSVGKYTVAHLNNRVDDELKTTRDALEKTEEKFWLRHKKDDISGLVLSSINVIGMVGSLLAFDLLQNSGGLSIKDFALFAYFITRFNAKLEVMPKATNSLYTAISDTEKIVSILSSEPTIKDEVDAEELQTNLPLEIEFKNVCFSYEDKQILDDVNFKVMPGETLAITGPTGIGKSTILRLLLRFYEPTSGEILINQRNIRDYTMSSLRAHFAVVSQDSPVFFGTVRENIQYGSKCASENDIKDAAEFAMLTADMPLDERLNSHVGRGGGAISGGERQRLTTARAYLKGGVACLLDEPTSALDPEIAAEFERILSEQSRNITNILITHRYNSTKNADRIIYLKKEDENSPARVHEKGTFESLVKMQGDFYNQCRDAGISLEVKEIKEDKRLLAPLGGMFMKMHRKRLGYNTNRVFDEVEMDEKAASLISSDGRYSGTPYHKIN